jgi:hypothetical protein
MELEGLFRVMKCLLAGREDNGSGEVEILNPKPCAATSTSPDSSKTWLLTPSKRRAQQTTVELPCIKGLVFILYPGA